MNHEQYADKRIGSLITQALGDSLGFLVEGHHPSICAAFIEQTFAKCEPPVQTRGMFVFGQYSDDTQLARELARSFVANPAWSPDDYASRIANMFALDLIVGRGRATEAAAHRLIQGVNWQEAGEPAPSAGNGAAMRAGPVGLHIRNPEERFRVADEQARITHADVQARAAAVLVADVVADAVHRSNALVASDVSADFCDYFAKRVQPLDSELAHGIRQLPEYLAMSQSEAAAFIARTGTIPQHTAHQFERWHGISPFATPSALFAMYAYCKAPTDAESVLSASIAAGGDVDTVAAMAGAMVGANVGWSGLSQRLKQWATRLNDQGTFGLPELARIAEKLGDFPSCT